MQKKEFSREEKMSDAFLILGSQYYALARYTAHAFFLPICATLFHHAIEMLLKGFLALSFTSAELRNFSHDLNALWKKFKSIIADNSFARFDSVVSQLDRVETLRYPDSMVDDGYVLNIRLSPPTSSTILLGTEHLPPYHVNVIDLDAIVLAVFNACKSSPTHYFKDVPTDLKAALPPSLLSDRFR